MTRMGTSWRWMMMMGRAVATRMTTLPLPLPLPTPMLLLLMMMRPKSRGHWQRLTFSSHVTRSAIKRLTTKWQWPPGGVAQQRTGSGLLSAMSCTASGGITRQIPMQMQTFDGFVSNGYFKMIACKTMWLICSKAERTFICTRQSTTITFQMRAHSSFQFIILTLPYIPFQIKL